MFKVLPVEMSTLLETANEMEIFFRDADSHFFRTDIILHKDLPPPPPTTTLPPRDSTIICIKGEKQM